MKSRIIDLNWRSIIRLWIFPKICTLLNTLGVSWYRLGKSKFGNATLIAQARRLARTFTIRSENKKPLNIIMATMLGGHPHNVTFEILLAWALRQKGHNVKFLLDDGALPINEDHRLGMEKRFKEISAKSYFFGNRYILSAGFEVLKVSDLYNASEVDKTSIDNYQHVIEAALLKHYKVGVLSKELCDLEEKKDLFVKSAKITSLIGKKICQLHPDRVIMSHGIYTTWGIILDKLLEKRIPVVTYGRGKKNDTKRLNWNISSDWWDVDVEWNRVKEIPLTKEEEQNVNRYIKSRISHSEDVLVYNFGDFEDAKITAQRFNLDTNKVTFTLFTNVLWDAASSNREIVFPDPISWVLETIHWFKLNPSKQLIVKIHPAEKVIGTNQSFISLINAEFEHIPENVRIIEPAEEVNSWSIMKVTDLGLVHTTTVGLELPLAGVPCAVVSSTYYRGKGFTIDIENKEQYFHLLHTFQVKKQSLGKDEIELAKRYAHLLFERYQIPVPYFNENKPLDTRSLKLSSTSELLEDEIFSSIITSIIKQKNFLLND